jgi:RecB family endonuclease NucS
MTALWRNDGIEWQLLPSIGFGDEAALHTLVEDAPQMLPLSGSPSLTVVGREVQLGGGYADLLAVETSGRPVVIEVKLARNAEARRAVVAQALA